MSDPNLKQNPRHTRRRSPRDGEAARDEASVRLRIQKMQDFCSLFPCLRGAPGTAPWDPIALDAYAAGPAANGQTRNVVAFILALWCGKRDGYWRVERFDILTAAVEWDEPHRMVFMAWLRKPWWP